MLIELTLQSESITKLATALNKVQANLKHAIKDSRNPFFKSKYADLAAVSVTCRDELASNGFSVVQASVPVDGSPYMVTTLLHSSGEWIRGFWELQLKKQDDPQAMGSAITYMRRYSLASMVGVVTDDDDGEAAMTKLRNLEISPAAETKMVAKIEDTITFDGFEAWSKTTIASLQATTSRKELVRISKAVKEKQELCKKNDPAAAQAVTDAYQAEYDRLNKEAAA